MQIYLLYFLVIFLSNTVGAVSGMGGGVIIKPVLDAVGYHSLTEITFYSCVAVFTMSIASTYKQVQNGIKINWKNAGFVSLGSLIGGVLGNRLFLFLIRLLDETKVQGIQIILTILSLIFVLLYMSFVKTNLNLKNIGVYFVVGLFLGGFSTLLGIGGGPINVSLLAFFFGLSVKDATVYSIITIFCSQFSKLVEIGLTSGFKVYELTILLAIIPAALLGGFVGGILSTKLSEKTVSKVYTFVVWVVIAINLINGFQLIV